MYKMIALRSDFRAFNIVRLTKYVLENSFTFRHSSSCLIMFQNERRMQKYLKHVHS